jgi:hypothetical protein
MGNPMQAVLSIGGAAIGWLVTGGNPAGAAWGYKLETIRGTATFPTEASQEGAGDAHMRFGGNARSAAGSIAGGQR